MNWCCDCKNKYTNTKCDNCKSLSNFERGDATVELLEDIKAEISELLESSAWQYDVRKIIDNHIAELKGE